MRTSAVRAPALILLASCTAFRSQVIQAPTSEERARSNQLYAQGALSDTAIDAAKVRSPLKQELPQLQARIAAEKLFLHEDFRSSEAYCRNVMSFGQDAYKASLGWGIPLTLMGVAGTAAGTAWAAASDDKASGVAAKVGLAAASAVVAGVGLLFVGRASAAATASGNAGLAFVPGTSADEQWKICLAARAEWLGSNADAARIAGASSEEGKDAKDEDNDPGEADGKKKAPQKK